MASNYLYNYYSEIKKGYEKYLLLIEEGQIFYAFGKDAETIGNTLDIPVVASLIRKGERVTMLTFPTWDAEKNLKKLLESGFKIALATQDMAYKEQVKQ